MPAYTDYPLNSALMNDAVYKFKRYEDASLSYTGINKHDGEVIGLYDTVLSRTDYQATFVNEPVEAYQGTRETPKTPQKT